MNFKSLFNSFFPQEKKEENIFDDLACAAFIINAAGEIEEANTQALNLFGYSKEEMKGTYLSKYVEGGSVLLEKLLKSDKPLIVKGKTKDPEINLYVLLNAYQNPNSQEIIFNAQDITAFQMADSAVYKEYEDLKKNVDQKNLFLSKLSGDILNSTESVTGFSKAILDGVCGPLDEKIQKYMNIIYKNSSDITSGLSKVFEFFKLESNTYPYDVKKFDIVNLVSTVYKEKEPFIKENNKEVIFDVSSILIRNCLSDQKVVYTIVCGLLDFISKGTSKKVEITLSHPEIKYLNENGYEVLNENSNKYYFRFEVKSSSEVVSQAEFQSLFNPYAQQNQGGKLSLGDKFTFILAKRFLGKLNGRISIGSSEEAGTRIYFVIPGEKINIKE